MLCYLLLNTLYCVVLSSLVDSSDLCCAFNCKTLDSNDLYFVISTADSIALYCDIYLRYVLCSLL